MKSLVALLALVSVCAGCSMPRFKHSRSEQQEIETSPLTTLELSSSNGAVTVSRGDSPFVIMEVTYTAHGESEEEAKMLCEEMSTDIDAEDGRLTLKPRRPAGQRHGAASYRLQIPDNCAVVISTSNGKIAIDGLNSAVNLKTSNGAVTVNSVVGDIKVHTSNGAIRLEKCNGLVDLHTSNGRIEFDGDLSSGTSEMKTSNGAISIRLPDSRAAEVVAKTGNGRISTETAQNRIIEQTKRSLHMLVGSSDETSSDVRLNVQTSNGSISIKSLPASEGSAEPANSTQGEVRGEPQGEIDAFDGPIQFAPVPPTAPVSPSGN